MKKYLVIVVLLLASAATYAQVKTIKGQLLENKKKLTPISEAVIEVANRNIKITADKYGYFTLTNVTDNDFFSINSASGLRCQNEPIAQLNKSTVEVANYYGSGFIYIRINEIKITQPKREISSLLNNNKDGVGVYYLNDSTSTLESGMDDIDDIHYLKKRKERYELNYNRRYRRQNPIEGSFSSFIDLSQVGKLPQSSSPHFFRTGISYGNSLDLKMTNIMDGFAAIGLRQRKQQSPIPDANQTYNNLSFKLKNLCTGKFQSNFGIYYKTANEALGVQGSNIAQLMQSVLTPSALTPPAYTADFLIHNMRDWKESRNFMTFAKTSFNDYNHWDGGVLLSYQKQWDKQSGGLVNTSTTDRYSNRNENLSNLNLETKLGFFFDHNEMKVGVQYNYMNTRDGLDRRDSLIYYNSSGAVSNYKVTVLDYTLHTRVQQDIMYYYKYTDQHLHVVISNKHHFSNTLPASDYLNWFPTVSGKWQFSDLLYNLFNIYRSDLYLFGSAGRSLGEASLIYRNKGALSTALPSSNFASYYEWKDLFSQQGLAPEIYLKSEIGIGGYITKWNLSLDGRFYYNTTQNFIAPQVLPSISTDSLFLSNLGSVQTEGFSASATYYKHWSHLSCNTTLSFSRSVSRVVSFSDNNISGYIRANPFVRLGGFSDIATVFASGEQLGVIYGTTYLRDNNGQVVKDVHGNPEIDSQLHKLGNANPNFVLNLNPSFNWKKWMFAFALAYSCGGERWNGTQSYWDAQNAIKKPGEAYMEDASFARLSEVSLKYTYYIKGRVQKISLGVEAQNLLLITSYRGVDPSSTLFNYTTGSGLDLFNSPSSRHYSFSVTLDF